ncbi:MAG: sigma 54-interacting transcriptional regulator [Deltaproteobacteria bacterium]|nr:sigma 54-interacting transcriptional regulator [Deltaproteobacteria bacterium]
MEKLKLYYRGQALGEYDLGTRPLAVGRDQRCDIVIHDPQVAEHQLLIVARRGTVVAYDLAQDKRLRSKERHLPLRQSLALGKDYLLTRELVDRDKTLEKKAAAVETLAVGHETSRKLNLVVKRDGEVRRYYIENSPLQIGSAQDNEIVIDDSAVDARHCRLEPSESGLLVRDLGSQNGTFVNGVRVLSALLSEGGQLRIGRTDIRISACSDEEQQVISGMVARSTAMLDIFNDVRRVSMLSWPVLILGESGTGKEGIARALHQAGPRAKKNFVALNAGGLPQDLVESELFGHERGAFTGAASKHKGVFEQADGGTLFLDEIGELPSEMQARLLRVIESNAVRRIGGESEIKVDVRLVCATHRDLRAMANAGGFRKDLYYRLTRLIIEIPPLRSRREDVCVLANHFLRQIIAEVGYRSLTEDAISLLTAYSWPGNARELCNVISAACVAAPSRHIDAKDIDAAIKRIGGQAVSKTLTVQALQQAVADHKGNQSAAARALGIARSTLRDRLNSAIAV